jgi:DNA-binding CsgD family transcriptional regulator
MVGEIYQKGNPTMNKATAERIKVKNPENSLLYKLMEVAGLPKALAVVLLEVFLDWAMKNLAKCRPPNQIVRTVVAAGEPAGKPIKYCRTIEVNLSIDHRNDAEIQHRHGTIALRMARILRMTWEAYEQGGLVSYEDLSSIMAVNISTIKRRVKALRLQGFVVPTRGFIKDMGREPSHKVQICRLLCRGHIYTEITAITNHSERSIELYALAFGRVIALCDRGASFNDIRNICDQSKTILRAYINLYREHNNDEFRPHLDKLKRRFEACEGIPGPGQYPPKKKKADPAQQLKEKNYTNALMLLLQELLDLTKPVATLVAERVCQLHQSVFSTPDQLQPGQTIVLVHSAESAPKYSQQAQNNNRPLIPVVLSPWTDDKIDIMRSSKHINVKRALIADALAREAKEQGGTITVDRLALLLSITSSQMSACLAKLRQRQNDPTPIKGITEDAGATLTHKEIIIDLQDQGYTPPEISHLTLHSPESRDRYLKANMRVETLVRVLEQIPDEVQAARFLGIRRSVVRQYLNRFKRKMAAEKSKDQQQPTAADKQQKQTSSAK